MARYEHSGSAQDAHLVGTLSVSGLGLSIDSYGGWPTGAVNKFWIAIDPDTASEEHILVNTRSAGSLTIAAIGDRGKEGTTLAEHAAGAVVRHIFSATEADDLALLSDNNIFTGTANRFTGPDHYFGANANGGSGTRIHLGSLGDPNNAFVTAESSGADAGLILRPKGAGSVTIQIGGSGSAFSVDQYGNWRLGGAVTAPTNAPVIALSNEGVVPSGTPTSGGWLYVQAGALIYKGSAGTVTTVATA